MKVLVIGGSRFVGPLLIDKLLTHKHEVVVFNRGKITSSYPDGVTFVEGDRNEGFSVDGHFDVVVDMYAYTGEHTQRALDELSFDFFIHFGTISSYKHSEIFPITEDSPLGDWPLMGEYGKNKVKCEEVLVNSGKKYASIRPTYVLGANNYMDREQLIYTKLKNEESIVLPGNGQALNQFVFAKDVADIIVLLVEKQAEGAFNCVGDEAITLKGLVDVMAQLVGNDPVIEYNPAADGVNHDESQFPFANENCVFSNQKIKDLGFSFTPLLDGLKADYESYYKNA